MAKLAALSLILLISSLFVDAYARKLGPAPEEQTFLHHIGGAKEQLVKFDIYIHDLRVGNPTPTVYQVAKASITDTSPTSFGAVNAVDDLVTSGPSIDSPAVARIQGLTTSSDLSVNGVALNLNVVFTAGAGSLSGSTLCFLGRNEVLNERRELAVVGGTGVFRFARGYAVQTTTYYDGNSFYGVFKYTVYTTYNSKLSESADEVDIANM